MDAQPHISVEHLTLAYGDFAVVRDLSFAVRRGSIFFIIGGSGSGKSTLMRALLGLLQPREGAIFYDGRDFMAEGPQERAATLRRFGILYQGGALFTAMTAAENVGLPLSEYTRLSAATIRELAAVKLSLVGLKGFEDYFPSQLSGGMQRRAALARAIALDPEILFLDEPSSGLDPVTSRRLDELVRELRDSFGSTVVIVSHELSSILSIGDDCVFLDAETRTVGAHGPPTELWEHPPDKKIGEFLRAAHLPKIGGRHV
jgi:phospholipid/cholesterol/gamma-HCH transport system ATP-binding protein